MAYAKYDSASRRLVALYNVYCVPTGQGYCTNAVTILVTGRLQSYTSNTPSGSDCPSYPIKYSDTGKRLYKSTEASICSDVGAPA